MTEADAKAMLAAGAHIVANNLECSLTKEFRFTLPALIHEVLHAAEDLTKLAEAARRDIDAGRTKLEGGEKP